MIRINDLLNEISGDLRQRVQRIKTVLGEEEDAEEEEEEAEGEDAGEDAGQHDRMASATPGPSEVHPENGGDVDGDDDDDITPLITTAHRIESRRVRGFLGTKYWRNYSIKIYIFMNFMNQKFLQ